MLHPLLASPRSFVKAPCRADGEAPHGRRIHRRRQRDPAKGGDGRASRTRRRGNGDRPSRQFLSGDSWPAGPGPARAHDPRHGLRALFLHQGDHRDCGPAMRRGGPPRPRRAGDTLRSTDRRASGARGFRRGGQVEAQAAEARHHDPHADAAYRRLRLSLFQRGVEAAGRRARPARSATRIEARADDAAPVRSRRFLAIRPRRGLGRASGRGRRRRAPRRRAEGHGCFIPSAWPTRPLS